MAENRPGTIVWCMGGTQHTIGNNNTRSYCVLQLALGNIGKSGGGANIFRGHDNVQGATDLGVLSHTLPGYYGLKPGSWAHWARVWDTDLEYLKARFDPTPVIGDGGKEVQPMNYKGIPVSRWIDGVNEDRENIGQRDNVRAMVLWGHAVNSQTRGHEMKAAMEKLDLMVVIDPYPTHAAVMNDRTEGTYLLPASTQFETYGSVTASNRSIQWRDKVVDPVWESLPDHTIAWPSSRASSASRTSYFKNIKRECADRRAGRRGRHPRDQQGDVDDRLHRPEPRAAQAARGEPQDLRHHLAARRGRSRQTATSTECRGLRGATRTPSSPTVNTKGEMVTKKGHPGTPVLYNPSMAVGDGGLTFRARFGVERNGVNLLAEGVHSVSSDLTDGYPGVQPQGAEAARVVGRPHRRGEGGGRGQELEDRPLRRHPARRHQPWLRAVRQRQGPRRGVDLPGSGADPSRASVLAGSRAGREVPDLRGPQALLPVADALRVVPGHRPLRSSSRSSSRAAVSSSTRAEARSSGPPRGWRSCSRTCSSRSTPRTRTIGASPTDKWSGSRRRRKGTVTIKAKAMVTRRVAPGVVWTPFHFGGYFGGEDLLAKYPGRDRTPYVRVATPATPP